MAKAKGFSYKQVRKALGLMPASRNNGRLYYNGARNVSENVFIGKGGVADTYRAVERLRKTDPDAAVGVAGTEMEVQLRRRGTESDIRMGVGYSLKDVSPSYFLGLVQTAIDSKLRKKKTKDALKQAKSHRPILPKDYFAGVVRKHVEHSLGKRNEEEAMKVADKFYNVLFDVFEKEGNELLEATARAYYARMKKRGVPEVAFQHIWDYLDDDEFMEMGREAVVFHSKRNGNWRRAVEVAELGKINYGVELFNDWELRGFLEIEAFDKMVHERMSEEERKAVLKLGEDLQLPEVRRDQLSALAHETHFLTPRQRSLAKKAR